MNMMARFCFNGNFNGGDDVITEVVVSEAPTEAQCKAVADEVAKAMDEWESEHDDFSEMDLDFVCRSAAQKRFRVVTIPVVKTLYWHCKVKMKE